MYPGIDSVARPVCQGTGQHADFKVVLFIVVSMIIVVYVLYFSRAYASGVVLYCTRVYTQPGSVFQESRMPYSGEGNTFQILGCPVHSVSIFVHAYVPPHFPSAARFRVILHHGHAHIGRRWNLAICRALSVLYI
jgi:hypothetical protein